MTKNAFHCQFIGIVGLVVIDVPSSSWKKLDECYDMLTQALEEPPFNPDEGEEWKDKTK